MRGSVLLCEEAEQPKSHAGDERHHHILLQPTLGLQPKYFLTTLLAMEMAEWKSGPYYQLPIYSPFHGHHPGSRALVFPDIGGRLQRGCKKAESLKKGSSGPE